MVVQPYLYFHGRCDEALAFYEQALGAEVTFKMRHKDAPGEYSVEGDAGERIMHASFKVGQTTLMATDGMPTETTPPAYSGFSISVSLDNVAKGEKIFNALAEGGQVRFPWQSTFWAKGFGMVADKFGVPWMVNVENKEP
ncbi:VOC family protein [Trinickia dinghuensis]|uniref:VOC family protein n=1 Tax=Trinickia dinghuensis TaxID=2291023 RepID=A0A3D8JV03_9BURK|nr:VOC family protein [Trinickia dinghuensis]RDU96622.1 VOC family protein [Trinickia dinghuensis]